jgi:hypothetical protein
MSGGYFQYIQDYIGNIEADIFEALEQQGKEVPKYLWTIHGWDGLTEPPKYPQYPEEVQKRFKEAIYALKKAYIYAKRVDWYLSGDDGEEQFLKRLDEQLKQLDDEHLRIC